MVVAYSGFQVFHMPGCGGGVGGRGGSLFRVSLVWGVFLGMHLCSFWYERGRIGGVFGFLSLWGGVFAL